MATEVTLNDLGYCQRCGAPRKSLKVPITCSECDFVPNYSAKPVSVLLASVRSDDISAGVLLMQRGGDENAPGYGKFSLPSTPQWSGKSPTEALATFMHKEIRVEGITPKDMTLLDLVYSESRDANLAFYRLNKEIDVSELKKFEKSKIVQRVIVCYSLSRLQDIDLAFHIHGRFIKQFFAKK